MAAKGPYDGEDFDEWAGHFNIKALKEVLENDIGVSDLIDLVEIYPDAEMMADIQAKTNKLMFSRFVKAAPLTTVLGGVEVASEAKATPTAASSPPPAPAPAGAPVRANVAVMPPAPPTPIASISASYVVTDAVLVGSSYGEDDSSVSAGAGSRAAKGKGTTAAGGKVRSTASAAASAAPAAESSDDEDSSDDDDLAELEAIRAKKAADLKKAEESKARKAAKKAELEAEISRLEATHSRVAGESYAFAESAHALSSKKHNIKAKKSLLQKLEKDLEDVASLDVAFLLDCTSSMGSYIDSMKNQIQELGVSLKSTYPTVPMRLSFIGYRDHCDGDKRLAVLRFTDDVEEFKTFVAAQRATGGGDAPEDVFGALSVAGGLEWRSATRVLYHIADAPCHGKQYHDFTGDDHPDGDPNGLKAEDLLPALASQNVLCFFGKINSSTDKMIRVFNSMMGSHRSWKGTETQETAATTTGRKEFFETLRVTSGGLMGTISSSVASSMSSSVSFSASTTEKVDASLIPTDKSEPKWGELKTETILLFDVVLPATVSALLSGEDAAMVNAASPRTSKAVCAKMPFDKGSTRLAYRARHYDSGSSSSSFSRSYKSVIHKISIKTKASELTRNVYESVLANHCVGMFFAREFKKVKPRAYPSIELADIHLINYTERTPHYPYATQESALEGQWEKYNNNHGWKCICPSPHGTDHSVVQAFSHWTYHLTGGEMLLVDCQGVYDSARSTFVFTDPAIHCKDVTRFGGTNLGKKGFVKFFDTHECNDCCRALGLSKPKL